ncbi:ABC transporter ATP-binding protein/permease [Chitinasiproducens palmae]|uniref:Putative ATP-binding cassette transporter n=1 Tax=Chitinasiproducens palmae TaxID=1770053 RepID=A0A1H2PVH7_9BURK|nr:ABC transporter ATP-binding protein/permease [Chitinasiproducens palmae]SDV51299.1 putative ATP-binding cassette transporter [Chitinasiproducens palmae]
MEEKKISAWSLIKPYWVSEDRWVARGLLALIIALNLAIVYVNVQINEWSANFYNALQGKNIAAFGELLTRFTVLAFAFILMTVYALYFRQMLSFRWRRWLTGVYLDRWLGGGAFYRIERDRLADNPDQRISDDLQSLASTTLGLTLDLISTLVTLASFVTILWAISGPLLANVAGHQLVIPGYMVWAAAIYAVFGSLVIQRFGRPLVSINYQQQRVEADFRFGLIRVRENAEPIALYDGTAVESAHARTLFSRIRDNWKMVMRYTRRLSFVSSFYGQIAIIFPIAVAAPRYFAGAYTFGVLMQISRAFGTVSDSLSWFINNFDTLAGWRATVNRLREFERVLEGQHFAERVSPATEHGGIHLHRAPTPAVATRGLVLARPDGRTLSAVADIAIERGSRWLIRGPSGSGKSTLLRALAGLWPFGAGAIDIPVDAQLMFVPQRPYMPIDSLRVVLAYPSPASAHDDAACRDALHAVGLDGLGELLDREEHWANRLSPGEQQRIAFARVLLKRPDYLFLDEATSSLDPVSEQRLYTLLLERLPQTAIVSVAHREALYAFHDTLVEIGETGGTTQVIAHSPDGRRA